MTLDQWIELNEHMKRSFNSMNKVRELSSFPEYSIFNKNVVNLKKNKLIRVKNICVNVSINNLFSLKKYLNDEAVALVLYEFSYCISKIMEWYGVNDINIYGKNISGIFECDEKTDIDNALIVL